MARVKGYTLYFYSKSKSCILYFGIDGLSKKSVLKVGREMAKSLEAHYATILGKIRITVKAEEHKPASKSHLPL